MELTFIKPKDSAQIAKLTVHKTGKLGFSRGAMDMVNVAENRYAKFGYDAEDRLHLVMQAENDADCFPVNKAGAYYYINAKSLLEDLNIDYTGDDTIIFDVKKTTVPHRYRLSKRIVPKRK